MVIEIPDRLSITVIPASGLSPGWRNYRDYKICQALGDKWYAAGETAVLKVPSAVLPQENNFVLNATHKDFAKIKLVDTIPIVPDERLEEILKKYKAK